MAQISGELAAQLASFRTFLVDKKRFRKTVVNQCLQRASEAGVGFDSESVIKLVLEQDVRTSKAASDAHFLNTRFNS